MMSKHVLVVEDEADLAEALPPFDIKNLLANVHEFVGPRIDKPVHAP